MLGIDIVKHDFDPYVAAYVLRRHPKNIGKKARPLVQFDKRNHVRNFRLERRMIGAMKRDETIDLATARYVLECKIR